VDDDDQGGCERGSSVGAGKRSAGLPADEAGDEDDDDPDILAPRRRLASCLAGGGCEGCSARWAK